MATSGFSCREPLLRGSIQRSSHPALNVFELEQLLYTGKAGWHHVDEVWPGLYLGGHYMERLKTAKERFHSLPNRLHKNKFLNINGAYSVGYPWNIAVICIYKRRRMTREIAANKSKLLTMGITHILNASHSRWRGGEEYYEGMDISYMGIAAQDSPTFDMSVHFYPAAEFIHKALKQNRGKILVHCAVGVSRSATLVLAYLMIHHNMTLVDAITTVKDRRGIIPNRGFLRQLVNLDNTLKRTH